MKMSRLTTRQEDSPAEQPLLRLQQLVADCAAQVRRTRRRIDGLHAILVQACEEEGVEDGWRRAA